MEVTTVHTCGCKPLFNWKTVQTFNTHKKSNRHISFIFKTQEKEHRKTITEMQYRISRLQTEISVLLDHCEKLKRENLELKTVNTKDEDLITFY